MKYLHEFYIWITGRFTVIFNAEPYERFVGAVQVRGVIYVISDQRILRYDPDRDQFTNEHRVD